MSWRKAGRSPFRSVGMNLQELYQEKRRKFLSEAPLSVTLTDVLVAGDSTQCSGHCSCW